MGVESMASPGASETPGDAAARAGGRRGRWGELLAEAPVALALPDRVNPVLHIVPQNEVLVRSTGKWRDAARERVAIGGHVGEAQRATAGPPGLRIRRAIEQVLAWAKRAGALEPDP